LNVLQLSLPDIAVSAEIRNISELAQDGENEYQLILHVLKETNGVIAGLNRALG